MQKNLFSSFLVLTSFTALALYTAQSGIMKETGYKKPGWSYILGWCGGVMALLGSFIGISDNTIGKQIQVATDA